MARLYTNFLIEIEDPTGEDAPWSVEVRIPPMHVMDQLVELIPQPMDDMLAMVERPELAPVIEEARRAGRAPTEAELLAAMPLPLLIEMEKKASSRKIETDAVAAIVLQYAGEPKGLQGDCGGDLTWEQMHELNDGYYQSCIEHLAQKIIEAVRGSKAKAAEKNSVSSSAS